jgi:transcriptional regulator GlxA family with amidase domain
MSDSLPPLHTVAVLALPGVITFDLAIAMHVFGDTRAHGNVPKYRVLLCSAEAGRLVSDNGIAIDVPFGVEAIGEAHSVVIPAWNSLFEPLPTPVIDALQAADRRGVRMVSICAGAYALAQAGILDGHRVTTHWAWAAQLARRYPNVHVDPRVLYIDDGNVLTSAGMAAGLDLCLHIVRTDHGAETANRIARRMVVAPHREGGQAQYIEEPVPVTRDSTLQSTQAWVLERLHAPITVDEMARQANTSVRHFTRRFQAEFGITPLRWVLKERVRLAQRLLEQSDLPVERIAERAGFGSAIALRRQFNAIVGTSPLSYRLAFRGRTDGLSRVG